MCHLQELYTRYKGKGLVVLGINPSDDKKIALEMLRDNGATFPNIIDPSQHAQDVCDEDYAQTAFPASYVIDRNGMLLATWEGYDEGEPAAMQALQSIDGELGETVREECKARAVASSEAVTVAATRLFEAIRTADYDHRWLRTTDWRWFPSADVAYEPDAARVGWVRWVCKKFQANSITEVRLGKVFAGPTSLPTVHFTLQLKDGEVIEGDLPFNWDSQKRQWVGWKGLDWHLPKDP
jgi:hypothetical protein